MSLLFVYRLVALAALVAALVVAPVLPTVMTTVIIAAELLAMGLTYPWRGWREMLVRPAVGLPLLAGLLMMVALAADATSIIGVASIVVVLPALMTGPLLAIFMKARLRLTPQLIGWFATAGSALGMALALFDSLVIKDERAGTLVTNPIHFADISLLVGAFSLLGLCGTGRWRYLCLFGPLFAIVAIVLSGSRGALVTIVPEAVIALIVLLAGRRVEMRTWLGIGGFAIVAILLVGLALHEGWPPLARLVQGATDLLQTRPDLDESDEQRLEMYQAAWYAFRASPIFGHGLIDFTRIAVSSLPPGMTAPVYEHLHNDIADFAVIGGLFGLAGYGLVLIAPLAEAFSAPTGPTRRAAILGAALLSAGYFCMGLTNATFGILLLTVFFPVASAITAYFARPPKP